MSSSFSQQGEIKIGSNYQATVPSLIPDKDTDERGDGIKDESGTVFPELEERLWVPTKATSPETNNGHGDKGPLLSNFFCLPDSYEYDE